MIYLDDMYLDDLMIVSYCTVIIILIYMMFFISLFLKLYFHLCILRQKKTSIKKQTTIYKHYTENATQKKLHQKTGADINILRKSKQFLLYQRDASSTRHIFKDTIENSCEF